MSRVVVLSRGEEQAVARRLQDRPYWQLILGTLVLTALTAVDVAIVDCIPFVDEFLLASFSTAFVVALVRKVLKDVGVL
jgi:hypothetical protein